MFENPSRGRQAGNFATNVPKILDLKSSSEQIFPENCRWVLLITFDNLFPPHYDILAKTRSTENDDGCHAIPPKWRWFTREHYSVVSFSFSLSFSSPNLKLSICTDPSLQLRDPASGSTVFRCGLTAVFKRLLHTYKAQSSKIERVFRKQERIELW